MKFSQWLGFIAFILCLLVLWQIRQLLLLLFAAIVVANALNHLANWFQSKRIKRGYAIALSVSLLISSPRNFLLVDYSPLHPPISGIINPRATRN